MKGYGLGKLMRVISLKTIARVGKMIVNTGFDPRKYGFLLAQTLPAVSSTEADNERMLEAVNQ